MNYMTKYNDMSAFCITIDEIFLGESLDVLCRKMDFHLKEKAEDYSLYKSNEDERSFLLASKGYQSFYIISIKCKSDKKIEFFKLIEPQLMATQKLYGIPPVKFDDEIDWLHDTLYSSKSGNFLKEILCEKGLI